MHGDPTMWNMFAPALLYLMTGLAELRALQDDHDLIQLVQQGKIEAYQVLVERHELWLRRTMYHLVSNREDAEELAQTVFFKAYSAMKNFRQDANFKTWLRQICTRTAYDFYRHRARQRRDPDQHSPSSTLPQRPAQERVEILEAIQEALDKMPYPYKEILVLRYIEEMEMTDIEQILELGPGAARMRLTRAREHFRALYGELPTGL